MNYKCLSNINIQNKNRILVLNINSEKKNRNLKLDKFTLILIFNFYLIIFQLKFETQNSKISLDIMNFFKQTSKSIEYVQLWAFRIMI